MKDPQKGSEATSPVHGEDSDHKNPDVPSDSSRRSFLGTVGGATAVALAVGIPLEPVFEGKHGEAEASVVSYGSNSRANASWNYRKNTARSREDRRWRTTGQRRFAAIHRLQRQLEQMPAARRARHTRIAASWRACYTPSRPADSQTSKTSWWEIPAGPASPSTLNGPQGALAFDLEGLRLPCHRHPARAERRQRADRRRGGRALLGCADARRAVHRLPDQFAGGPGMCRPEQHVLHSEPSEQRIPVPGHAAEPVPRPDCSRATATFRDRTSRSS